MLQRSLWCVFAGFGALCHASQVSIAPHVGPQPGDTTSVGEAPEQGRLLSFDKPHHTTGGLSAKEDHGPLADWLLDDPPSVNSTAHFIFETTDAILSHLPDLTFVYPGFGAIPEHLYHGTWHSELPPGPDWAAFDPEHSVIFCGGLVEDGRCWHLTLMTTRPLAVVYFDGTGAVKLSTGTLDSQDIVTWGDVRPGWSFDEWSRITTLCDWGREYNVDGFNGNELVMLCNFTSGVRVVSSSNIVDPLMPRSTSSKFSPTFEAMYAGSRHNLYPGETRIQLDLSGLVSFYDTDLVPSLVPARFRKERWDHRLQNVSTEDVVRVKARLEEALSRPAGRSSDIDWQALIRVVVDRYSERLQITLSKPKWQLRHMLMPYIGVNVTPCSIDKGVKETASDMLDWTRPVYKLCATTHTDMLKDCTTTSSEKLLLTAVQGTTREICRVVTKMWGLGVLAGVDQFMGIDREPDMETTQRMMKTWRKDIDELMAWLDWNVWVKCRPECSPEVFPLDDTLEYTN
ncbi:hypothetical protein F5141DRAFT_1233451 [Pisolithus sp. B1]|nr:hypothetical protein F5141DRAFT_1233451 [Pisolithus sp. B1]